MTWRPVKDYIEKHTKVKNSADEPIYFDHYDPSKHTRNNTQDNKFLKEYFKHRCTESRSVDGP